MERNKVAKAIAIDQTKGLFVFSSYMTERRRRSGPRLESIDEWKGVKR